MPRDRAETQGLPDALQSSPHHRRWVPDRPPSSAPNSSTRCLMAEPLPDFENPPVVETILSARFRSIPGFGSARVGQFWSAYLAQEFPTVEERAPFEAALEPLQADDPVRLQLQLTSTPPVNRSWFVGSNEVVQLQSDWVAFNWRKSDANPDYIRYSACRPRFEKLLADLAGYLKTSCDRKLEILQAEITYVNHIELTADEAEHGPLTAVFSDISSNQGGYLPHPQQSQLQASYEMTRTEQSVGRLHLDAQTVPGATPPAIRMVLTARGRPLEASAAGALTFCDLGHQWIVRGFKDLTTETMWNRWKLKEDPR